MWEMENNDDSWSLLAVVRECTMKTRTITSAPDDSTFIVDNPISSNHSLYSTSSSSFDELVDLYKPFLVQSPSPSTGRTIISDSFGPLPNVETGCDSGGLAVEPRQNPPQQHQLQAVLEAGAAAAAFQPQQQQHDDNYQLVFQPRNSQNRRAPMGNCCPVGIHKKKRFEERRVCKMRLDELSDDKWAWRKYGQKPIKGSPYPRNYYRCSSSKGCGARKQVERNPVDQNTYLVTYTGHHYHARPPPRGNSSGSRVTRTRDPASSPEGESDDNPVPPPMPGPDQNGSGLGLGEPAVNADENEEDDEEEEDYEVELIPNSMADPELLMGMERLRMMEIRGERKNKMSTGGVENGCEYHHEMMVMKEIGSGGSGPNVNLGMVVRENGLCLGIQQSERGLDSSSGLGSGSGSGSAPTTLAAAHESPTSLGHNIWDNGMISPKHFLF